MTNYNNAKSEIDGLNTINTGGNVYNDIIFLKNDQVIIINDNGVYLFNNIEDYESGNNFLGIISRLKP